MVKDLGIDLDKSELDAKQMEELCRFLANNRDIFAKDLSELGETHLHQHTIYTKDERPVSCPPYRQTPEMRRVLDEKLDEMLEAGVIEESSSPYHSPVVLVKKPNGEYRFCVDFRKLNQQTIPISFSIPNLTDVFDTLADAEPEIFSSVDLRSGFWQVPLDPATKHKAAFITHRGVFNFHRLPMGLSNSSLSFQALMCKVLKSLNFRIALVYIDDILIFSKNFSEHLSHLSELFAHLRNVNLKLNPSKCEFATKSIKYLGHIVSKDGVKVDPSNVEKVKNFPRPSTSRQVKSFLGMANF